MSNKRLIIICVLIITIVSIIISLILPMCVIGEVSGPQIPDGERSVVSLTKRYAGSPTYDESNMEWGFCVWFGDFKTHSYTIFRSEPQDYWFDSGYYQTQILEYGVLSSSEAFKLKEGQYIYIYDCDVGSHIEFQEFGYDVFDYRSAVWYSSMTVNTGSMGPSAVCFENIKDGSNNYINTVICENGVGMPPVDYSGILYLNKTVTDSNGYGLSDDINDKEWIFEVNGVQYKIKNNETIPIYSGMSGDNIIVHEILDDNDAEYWKSVFYGYACSLGGAIPNSDGSVTCFLSQGDNTLYMQNDLQKELSSQSASIKIEKTLNLPNYGKVHPSGQMLWYEPWQPGFEIQVTFNDNKEHHYTQYEGDIKIGEGDIRNSYTFYIAPNSYIIVDGFDVDSSIIVEEKLDEYLNRLLEPIFNFTGLNGVYKNNYKYEVSNIGVNGLDASNNVVSIVNNYIGPYMPDSFIITIKKVVDSEYFDVPDFVKDKEWVFQFGDESFTLKDGESKTFTFAPGEAPDVLKEILSEDDLEYWRPSARMEFYEDDGYHGDSNNCIDNGDGSFILETWCDNKYVVVTNKLLKELPKQTTGLKLSKIVSGSSIENSDRVQTTVYGYANTVVEGDNKAILTNNSKLFGFIVKLTDGDNIPLNETYQYIKTDYSGEILERQDIKFNSVGEATVYLKHEETVQIFGLPLGVNYEIIEIDNEYYRTNITVTDNETNADIKSEEFKVLGKLNTEIDSETLLVPSVSIIFTNIPYYELPDAGGIGIAFRIIIGLMFIAFSYMITKKSKNI